ncbi:PREDICTED: protein FAM124B [Elephantulus edwardii]|uniref:protein FAM124B n=1 Tax=Elephantulus edwardii TaxID=28737 RepID=UPI0003F09D53|nr:PREDICTED: protein FAM124B [Elephantulus edwardii]
MGERQESLALTVHLLANSGHGSFLQRTLDQLLDGICPEVPLFLVSERVSPMKSYEKHHAKHSRFPGISVLLFLHESRGEERMFRVLSSLQHSPWQYYPTENAQRKLCPSLLASHDFYSLDHQMPVWGVRQVHCGSEILRVTLYCSFDNYEDAIRLYEMVLQKEATLQKSNFCFFELYSTSSFTLQLSLKQLPPGMSVDPKEAAVLQFKVQEIGQLVPLLPNPCVPISSTRWQTQDYDGNKILLQVQTNPELGARNGELSSGADMLSQGSKMASVSTKNIPEPRSRRSRTRNCRLASLELLEPGGNLSSESRSGASWRSPSWPLLAGSPVTDTQLHLPSPDSVSGVKAHSQGTHRPKLEAETNVDTGFTVVNSEAGQSPPSRLQRGLHPSQPLSCLPAACSGTPGSHNNRIVEERDIPLSRAGQRDPDIRKTTSKCPPHQTAQTEEKGGGEEFFI